MSGREDSGVPHITGLNLKNKDIHIRPMLLCDQLTAFKNN